MNNHRNICQNIFMIIFLCIIGLLVILLCIKWKIHFYIVLENTKSKIKIRFLFYHFAREGSFVFKPVKNEKSTSNGKKKNKKKTILDNIKIWFLKNIYYENVKIYEKVGVATPFLTSIFLPIVATMTTFPLHFFKMNYHHFQYDIIPDYQELHFSFQLNATASFRVIDLFKSILIKRIN